jgi:hypothetical protein
MKWETATDDAGVIIATDRKQEWFAFWFLNWFYRANDLPVTLVDCGISENMKKVLTDSHEKLRVVPGPKNMGWWVKPLAIMKSTYRKTVWMDVDCKVRANIARLIECRDDQYIMLRQDEPYDNLKNWTKNLVEGEVMYNSGVVAVSHGHPIIPQWVVGCRLGEGWFRGDQEVLSRVIHIYAKQKGWVVHKLPRSYNNLRLDDYQDPAAVVQHLTGPEGKRQIINEVREWRERKK